MQRRSLVPSLARASRVPLLLFTWSCSAPSDGRDSGGADIESASPSSYSADAAGLARGSATAAAASPNFDDVARVTFQIPGRNLQEDPPRIESADFVPAEAGGEPHLVVQFGEVLPDKLAFLVEGRIRELHDDGSDGDLRAGDGIYTATVPSDFEATIRSNHADERIPDLLPLPTKRVVLANTTPYPPWSLLITDLNVVNDPARVSDPCTSYASPSASGKEWSFGYLMTHMANQSGTGKTPDAFARAWLDAWRNPATINGESVVPPILLPPNAAAGSPSNISVPEYILRTWREASRVRSDGTLDPNTNPALKMEKAPFRLLAIVNRLDKRKNAFFGEGTAGELRFVFGVLDSKPSHSPWLSACRPLDTPTTTGDFKNSTVILEYAVDKATPTQVKDWAGAWRYLTLQGPPENAGYRDSLQSLTDSIVRAGAGSSKNRANGSALIRIRTNESIDSVNWRLREFAIDGASHVLTPRTVKQTPMERFNGSSLLKQYINADPTAIINETNVVPTSYGGQSFLAGQALNFSGGKFWNATGISNLTARHKFSVNTCNGCHSVDTGTFFAHVMSRNWDEEAQLSGFLTGISVSDPVSGQVRTFDEFTSRTNDMMSVLGETSLAALIGFRPDASAD